MMYIQMLSMICFVAIFCVSSEYIDINDDVEIQPIPGCFAARPIFEIWIRYLDDPSKKISTKEKGRIRGVFDYYDTDSNNKWSFHEFIRYSRCFVNFEDIFESMNYYNNDQVLSFRELVAYFMHFSDGFNEYIQNIVGPIIETNYDFVVETNDDKQLFYEHLADLYLLEFDKTQEGFIMKQVFTERNYKFHFYYFQVDENEEIAFDDFYHGTFGVNALEQLIEFANIYLDENYEFIYTEEDFFKSGEPEDPLSYSFEICPSVFDNQLKVIEYRRRLQDIVDSVNCGVGSASTVVSCLTSPFGCINDAIETSAGCTTVIADAAQDDGGCFGESNFVFIKHDPSDSDSKIQKIQLSELKIGDYIQSRDVNTGNIIWSKVWFINEHNGYYSMKRIQFIDYNGIIGNITLTNDHLIYHNDFILNRADNLLIGDTIKIIDYASKDTFIDVKIIDIISEYYDFARSPITMDGDIVISNILASSYTKSVSNAEILHKSSKFLRDVSQINTQFAAYLVNFFYNYVYKLLKLLCIDQISQFYLFVPMFFAFVSIFLVHFACCG